MKHISVMTNDPVKPKHSLTITGKVENIATISPKKIRFSGPSGQPLNATVNIIPEKKYAFKIIEATAKKGEYIAVSIMEEKKSEGTAYVLTVENLKKDNGRYVDTVYLKTTSKIQPTIKIPVFGNIFEEARKKQG